MVKIYHNQRCSKSRSACSEFESAGVEHTTVRYLDTPLDRDSLNAIVARLEDPVSALVRTGDKVFRDLNLRAADYTDPDAVVDLLIEHPRLMERPLIDDGTTAFIGRPTERVVAFLTKL
jgi:arsenate reductase (glutaredoxin)